MCDKYLKDLRENANLGASIMDSAIQLSLKYLGAEQNEKSDSIDTFHMYSIREMYTSLCVLDKQQWIPLSVLARMWAVDDMSARRIALSFSSMSLAKTSVQQTDAEEKEVGLKIHDLPPDFCHKDAGDSGMQQWHFRLLTGHMYLLSESKIKWEMLKKPTNLKNKAVVVSGRRLADILLHTPSNWLAEDVVNKNYIFKNLTRHLLEAGLILELWALVLDPQWM